MLPSSQNPSPLQSANSADAYQESPQTNPQQKRSMFPMMMIGLIVLVILAGLGWYGYKYWYPSYLVKQFVTAHIKLLRNKEYQTAYNQTTAGLQEAFPLSSYQKYVDVQGLSNGDISYKVTKSRAYVNERNLTKNGEVLIELKGDTGQIQPVRFMLIKELGDYRVRLIELPGESDSGSWIGVRYDDEKLSAKQEMVVEADNPDPTNDSTNTYAPVAPTNTTTETNVKSQNDNQRSWNNVETLASAQPMLWEVVNTDYIVNSAKVAAEQHFGYVRFANRESVLKAIEQLHPRFKAVETPETYIDWLSRMGVINRQDFDLSTGRVEVRRSGKIVLAKVEFLLKDFRTTDGTYMPADHRVYVGLVGSLDSQDFIKWQDWYVISMFSEEYIKAVPSFFPF